MITTTQRFTAEIYLDLPDGVIIISPAYFTPEEIPRYRMVASSERSLANAQEKLLQAAVALTAALEER